MFVCEQKTLNLTFTPIQSFAQRYSYVCEQVLVHHRLNNILYIYIKKKVLPKAGETYTCSQSLSSKIMGLNFYWHYQTEPEAYTLEVVDSSLDDTTRFLR